MAEKILRSLEIKDKLILRKINSLSKIVFKQPKIYMDKIVKIQILSKNPKKRSLSKINKVKNRLNQNNRKTRTSFRKRKTIVS